MDLSLVIAALSLLVAAVAEYRQRRSEADAGHVRSLGIGLLELIMAIDNVIRSGSDLLEFLSMVPISAGDEKTTSAVLKNKLKVLLPAIELHESNVKALVETFTAPLQCVSSRVRVSLGDAIKLLVPDKSGRPGESGLLGILPGRRDDFDLMGLMHGKRRYLKILNWKVAEVGGTFDQMKGAVKSSLSVFANSIKVNKRTTVLELEAATRFTVKIEDGWAHVAEATEVKHYNLLKADDLTLLLENASKQLDELRSLRRQLAELFRASFDIEDLLQQSAHK